jgi:hypothetical protein
MERNVTVEHLALERRMEKNRKMEEKQEKHKKFNLKKET